LAVHMKNQADSSLVLSSRTAISRSRARPSRIASTKTRYSYKIGYSLAALGAVLYNGASSTPRTDPCAMGQTGGGSGEPAITRLRGGAAWEVGMPRVMEPR